MSSGAIGKYGYKDEFFEIFRKYQIPILNREQELGFVTSYSIYSPNLHVAGDSRWDYRVIITYRNQESSEHEAEVIKHLFPDPAALKRDEDRRWQLTENHWDMAIDNVEP